MPEGADRREARRFNMTLPLRLLPTDSNSPELQAQTRDVSYRGLYFLAGSPIQAWQRHRICHHSSRTGHALQRRQHPLPRPGRAREPTQNGRVGIAAKIDRYEFLHAA